MGVSVALAIAVGLVSSFVQSLGLTIQRKSHVQEELLPLPSRRKPVKRPLWLLGFLIYITSNIFSTIFQLDALPIVILAPLGAVSLIFNALLARLILGDTFGISAIVGTALVTVGAVMIAIFGVVQEEEHTLDELLKLWKRGPFLAFFSILIAAVVILLVMAHVAAWHVQKQLSPGLIKLDGDETPPVSEVPSNYGSPYSPAAIPFRPTNPAFIKSPSRGRRWSSPTATTLSIPPITSANSDDQLLPSPDDTKPTSRSTKSNGVRFAKSPPNNLTIDLPPSDPSFAMPTAKQQRTLTLAGLAFAAASGTLSGMSLVLAKAAVELLVITIDHFRTGKGSNEFKRPESWFLVAGLGIGAVLQLVYLNYSLSFASPALICPLAFCFFNLSSIFDGLVFYDQFGSLQPYQIALVSIGVAILLLGVWVVSLVKPTGQGGVEVGTWVEDDQSTCSDFEPEESTTLLGGEEYAEPEEDLDRPPSPTMHRQPGQPDSPAGVYSPRQPSALWSPGPLSPTARRRSRGPRYGTLIPDYGGEYIAPAGFSIGLGAASPGFMLRGEHTHAGQGQGYNRYRAHSESQAGTLGIIHGRRSSMSDSEHRRGDQEGNRLSLPSGEEDHSRVTEREQEQERRRGSWWRGLISSREGDGRIRLPEGTEDRGGGDGGDGD